MHLRERLEHSEKCTRERCASGCGFAEFDQWLAGPLTKWDAIEDERIRERAKALLRGDI